MLQVPVDIKTGIEKASALHTLPVPFITAVCMVESSFDQAAIRYEPAFYRLYLDSMPATELRRGMPLGSTLETERCGRAFSWGPMQLMGQVARERGYSDWFARLCTPEVGIDWGCRHLVWLRQRIGRQDLERMAGAYNGGLGSPNVAYASKVLRAMESLS